MSIITTLLGPIVLEGMKIWSEERRTRFKDKYHDILTRLEEAHNANGSDYFDSVIDFTDAELRIFMEAYYSELQKANVAILRQ